MNLPLRKPYYRFEPIGSIDALARALGLESERLVAIAADADRLYRLAKPIVKSDGSIRQPLDALPALKTIHRRLKTRILAGVVYPEYLTGSLVGRDYRVNADLHKASKIIICEDISNFFPSVKAAAVFDVWQCLFNFPPDVAELLTMLCIKNGALPQGAIPSSYLANLVLWRFEPDLQARFATNGLVYSRYVDDIAVSSKRHLSRPEQTEVIRAIYGMLAKAHLTAKRRKHETFTSSQRMLATKLVVNKRPALPKEKRAKIRAAVHRVEQLSKSGLLDAEGRRLLNSVAVQVGQLGRFHIGPALQLKERLALVRRSQGLHEVEAALHLQGEREPRAASLDSDESPPW
jgi:hypothetical protein